VISREHTIHVAKSGLLTIAGGKWTTYRKMAEDCVDHAATLAELADQPCVTRTLAVHGSHDQAEQFGELRYYGSDAPAIQQLMAERPEWSQQLHPDLPIYGAQAIWAARHEMARTVDDVLARRTRALFLNAAAAMAMAPQVAKLLATELGQSADWVAAQCGTFENMARNYLAPTTLAEGNS
jgi:glycerol-3-phosphate dehydrogenase